MSDVLKKYDAEVQLDGDKNYTYEIMYLATDVDEVIVALHAQLAEARARIKELESEKHTSQCQDMEGT
jgi:hypothetical protein